ncbi:MAG: peptide-methionine (S)-S-oxide reductase [Hyphomicrobiales bacterium]|nr:MAG: peptide-methionine (S)-S-oxide reductase [Hyphomicrobiales bacterium]
MQFRSSSKKLLGKKSIGRALAGLMFAIVAGSSVVAANAETKTAVFAGGCFWCVESDFETVDGVVSAESGYTGGTSSNPTYKNHMKAQHIEAVKIIYDPAKVNYETLLNIFWRSVNPTDAGGQFCDRGHSYTTAVFAQDQSQLKIAQASKKKINEAGIIDRPIITPIREATPFYPAEGYHQDYYKKNPLRYAFYRKSCGRNNAVKALWGSEAYFGIHEHKGS